MKQNCKQMECSNNALDFLDWENQKKEKTEKVVVYARVSSNNRDKDAAICTSRKNIRQLLKSQTDS